MTTSELHLVGEINDARLIVRSPRGATGEHLLTIEIQNYGESNTLALKQESIELLIKELQRRLPAPKVDTTLRYYQPAVPATDFGRLKVTC